jgi:hypothetical protein
VMWWGGDHMGPGGWIGMGFMILFWIAVVVGVVYLIREEYAILTPSHSSRFGPGEPGECRVGHA